MGVKKSLIYVFILLVFAIKLASAVECGSQPTNGCTVSVDTTFDTGTYGLQNGISIVANNVILDCNMSILEGTGSFDGINTNQQPTVTVKGCEIKNYVNGMYIFSSGGSVINNTFYNNTRGAYIYLSGNLNVRENIIKENTHGIEMLASGVNITNNTIKDNTGYGVLLQGTSFRNDINANIISNNSNFGVYINTQSTDHVVWDNDFYDMGIWYTSTANTFCVDNIPNRYFNGATGPTNCTCIPPLDNVLVNNDVTFCAGTYNLPSGVNIAGGVTLDCNANVVFNGSGNNNGIYSNQINLFNIKNCQIQNYNNGINLHWAYANNIINNTLINNNNGIFNDQGSGGNVLDNRFINNIIGVYHYGIVTNYTNNFFSSNSNYNFYNAPGVGSVSAEYNCWGTSLRRKIAESIYDYYENPSSGIVFFEPYISGYACGPGVGIVDIIPVQVVENVDVIKRKTTLVRVQAEFAEDPANITTVVTDLYVNGSLYDTNSTDFAGGEIKNIDFMIPGSSFDYASQVEFKAVLTTGITGFNDTYAKTMVVNETNDINLFFVPINNVNFANAISNNIQFIKDTYPLADNGLEIASDNNSLSAPTLPDDREGQQEILNDIEENILSRAHIAGQPFLNAIGIVPNVYLSNYNKSNGEQIFATGLNFNRGGPGVILVTENQIKTLAHELGHTFEFCEEYNETDWSNQNFKKDCPNGDLDNNEQLDDICLNNPAGTGCPTSTLPPLYRYKTITDNDTLRNFMGAADDPPPNFESWVSNDSYENLLNRMHINSGFLTSRFVETSEEYLIIRGKLTDNNLFEISPYYRMKGGFINNKSAYSGGYSFEIRDSNNQEISSISFEPNFFITAENGDTTPRNKTVTVFAIPIDDNATKVQLKNGTILIDEINKTPNSPLVNLNYPIQDVALSDEREITWNASDADNDTLSYALVLNKKDASNITLNFDLNQTNYTFNFSTVAEGDDYSLTLLATDGFNTATTTSGIFCVDNDLSVCGLKLLATNQTTAIFEFIITNTLNNTQEDINWTLDTGDTNITSTFNFNLTAYEDIFVYIEHTYGVAGNYIVIATAGNINFTDSQSINITI